MVSLRLTLRKKKKTKKEGKNAGLVSLQKPGFSPWLAHAKRLDPRPRIVGVLAAAPLDFQVQVAASAFSTREPRLQIGRPNPGFPVKPQKENQNQKGVSSKKGENAQMCAEAGSFACLTALPTQFENLKKETIWP